MRDLHGTPHIPTPRVVPGEVDFYPPDVVDDDWLDRFAVVGPAEECAVRLLPILNLGIRRLIIGTRAVGVDPGEENTARIAEELLPLLRD
jgi:5,10-methylenetetrahydromethanopterin reductase